MSVPDTLNAAGKLRMPIRLIANRYELREILGEGGMGVVYRAVDTRTGGFVAIKTIRDVSDPRTVEMFKKEWRVLAHLSHPNIVGIRDVDEFEEDGVRKPCFIMPLLPGITLAALIKDGSRRLTVEKTVGMLHQVCNGLEAAHRAGLIHRDLKPSNIFVTEDDTPIIIDFGLVYSAEGNSVTGHKGTWQYMAPEQTEGKTPSICSDIFSLGVVAYETFTSRKPFARSSVEATVDAIRNKNPPVISEINPKVSQLLSKVIHKAIAKQPIHRYASAREFGETLQKAYLNQPIERFETTRILPRIERARKAFAKDDPAFASEILTELEAEGNVDPEISLLRAQIDEAVKHKRIRQLLESAQTRAEQDEVFLALEKLREVLEIDPENVEAPAIRRRIEAQRSSDQISDWMNLARQHLQLQDFIEARQALKEVLNVRYDDSDALQLLAEVDVQEKESAKARAEKEVLYGSALRAHQAGEISAALSKLEKILEVTRRTPGGVIPERDAVYQSFYNRVRSERDSIDKGYEDGRRLLNEKEFQRALEVCNGMLAQYPHSAQFQALKLKIEQAERQELSAYIAEIGKSTDSEPDLNRRVNILEEACRRYPNEAQFQLSLRLSREQRDLVQSISAKARSCEEQSQFAEAIGHWKILRNIHPQYPGIEVEIGQLERRREHQIREEKKARFVEQIDRAMDNSSYAQALRTASDALSEFPQDPELVVLEKIAREGLERTGEAERLFEEFRKLRTTGRLEEATDVLQRALKLDERNSGLRNALVSLLVERANSLLDTDWKKAEPLAQAALELDEDHPAAKRLAAVIVEAKRKDCVSQWVAQARQLQSGGDIPAALNILEDGLSQYPDDGRLLQSQASLRNSAQRKGAKLTQPAPAAVLGEGKEPTPLSAPLKTESPVGPTNGMGAPPIDKGSELFLNSIANSVATTVDPVPSPRVADANKEKPNVSPAAEKERPSAPILVARPTRIALPEPQKQEQRPWTFKGIGKNDPKLWGILGVAVLIVAVMPFLHSDGKKRPEVTNSKVSASPKVVVPVTTSPSDATVSIENVVEPRRTLLLPADRTFRITATKVGYKPFRNTSMKAAKGGWNLVLEPEPVHLQVLTSERTGLVFLDGREIWKLDGGDMMDYTFPADNAQHTLSARNNTGELLKVTFTAAPGQSPKLDPLPTGELIASSSLGDQVVIFDGTPGKSLLELPGRDPVEVNRLGQPINVADMDSDATVATLSGATGRRTFLLVHGNAPTLVLSLKSNPNLGSATITTTVLSAKLFVDGRERKTRKPGFWHFPANPGAHEIRLIADGYAPETRSIQIRKGQDANQTIEPSPAASELVVEGGTTGAEVFVDGSRVGTIGATSSLKVSVAPGQHQISVQKAGFENLSLPPRNFNPGQSQHLQTRDVILKPFGTINFSVQPSFAEVSYRRSGETDWHTGSAGQQVKVRAGTYEVSAKAPAFKDSQVQIVVGAGEVAAAELRLTAISAPPPPAHVKSTLDFLVSPDEVKKESTNWFTGISGKFIALKRSATYDVVFLAPKLMTTPRKPKHFAWQIVVGPNTELEYELDGQQLVRKVKIDGKTSKAGAKVNALEGSSIYPIMIVTEPHVVRITKKDGAVLDEFVDNGNDWSRGAVSIKGDAFFVMR